MGRLHRSPSAGCSVVCIAQAPGTSWVLDASPPDTASTMIDWVLAQPLGHRHIWEAPRPCPPSPFRRQQAAAAGCREQCSLSGDSWHAAPGASQAAW